MKAVVFDVGHTLVNYRNPLNWSGLYEPALKWMFEVCGRKVLPEEAEKAAGVLGKYNTRIHPREKEYTDREIFTELLAAAGAVELDADRAADAFFAFFQAGAEPFSDVVPVLKALKREGYLTGILTDVAYGMNRNRAFQDIKEFEEYIDLKYTSVDIRFRKPNTAGYLKFSGQWGISPGEIVYVGDEEKDIIGAGKAGMKAVLLDRKDAGKQYGADAVIHGLEELFMVLGA